MSDRRIWVSDDGEERPATTMDLIELRHFGNGGEHGDLRVIPPPEGSDDEQ